MAPAGVATSPRGTRWPLFAALIAVWGINYLFVREGLSFSAPLWLGVLRSGIGVLGLAAVLPWRSRGRRLTPVELRDALILGVPSTGLFFGLWLLAAGSVLPGLTSVLIYTFPLWVGILSWPVLHQRLGSLQWLAIAAGFGGVVLVSQPWMSTSVPPLAVLELIGGAVSWAVGTVLFVRRFDGAAFERANAFQMLGGFSVLLVAAVAFEPRELPAFTPELLGISLWLGLAGTAFAYAAWYSLLREVPASRLSAYLFLVPVVSLSASAVIFGERLAAVQIAGVVLVLAGLYTLQRVGSRTPDSAKASERASGP